MELANQPQWNAKWDLLVQMDAKMIEDFPELEFIGGGEETA
jgi:hypothetical protein